MHCYFWIHHVLILLYEKPTIYESSIHQAPVSGTSRYNLPLQRNICIRLQQLSRHSPITHWQPEMKPLLLRNPSSLFLFLRHQKGEGSSDDLIVHGANVILPSDGRGQVKSLIIENAFWRILPTDCLRRKWVGEKKKISFCRKLYRWVVGGERWKASWGSHFN